VVPQHYEHVRSFRMARPFSPTADPDKQEVAALDERVTLESGSFERAISKASWQKTPTLEGLIIQLFLAYGSIHGRNAHIARWYNGGDCMLVDDLCGYIFQHHNKLVKTFNRPLQFYAILHED